MLKSTSSNPSRSVTKQSSGVLALIKPKIMANNKTVYNYIIYIKK